MEVKHNGAVFYSWMDDHVTYHQPTTFSTLTHVTSMENTEIILQEGFKMQVVGDYSCVNKLNDSRGSVHPLARIPFLWMAPDNHETTSAIRYGNVAFSLKELTQFQNLRFYYIEFLDYVTKTATRVMVTNKNYDHLFLRFDPNDATQAGKIPVMYNGNEWIRYTSFSNKRNDRILLDVEFLLDFTPSPEGVYCRYVKCFDPRPIVTPYGKVRGAVKVYNGNLDVLRLLCLLVRYQGLNTYELHSNTFITELVSTIQSIRCRDDFVQDYGFDELVENHDDCNFLKADCVFARIDFGKVFDTKEYSELEWRNVQILDFIYHGSGSIPNTQTMLNVLHKAIKRMKSEKTMAEVFALFFRCFLSSGAKKQVKKAFINMLLSL